MQSSKPSAIINQSKWHNNPKDLNLEMIIGITCGKKGGHKTRNNILHHGYTYKYLEG